MTDAPLVAASRRLTHAGARAMMAAAIDAAEAMGVAASVAIVAAGGHLLVFERMEGGRFHTVHSASTKAATAASNRRPTASRGAQGQALDAEAVKPLCAELRGSFPAALRAMTSIYGAR